MNFNRPNSTYKCDQCKDTGFITKQTNISNWIRNVQVKCECQKIKYKCDQCKDTGFILQQSPGTIMKTSIPCSHNCIPPKCKWCSNHGWYWINKAVGSEIKHKKKTCYYCKIYMTKESKYMSKNKNETNPFVKKPTDEEKSDSVYIYILELEQGKYYIGKTSNPQFRLNTHFKSSDTSWTTEYKPCRIEKLIPDCDSYDEDKYTLKYMSMHGIDNVRGGSFCQIDLSPEQINQIKNMIKGAENKCYNCGSNSHFAKDCLKSIVDSHLQSIDKLNIQHIKQKIREYNQMYENILKLKICIKETSFKEDFFEEVIKFSLETNNRKEFVKVDSIEQKINVMIYQYRKYILNQDNIMLDIPILKPPEILVLELINYNCEQQQKLNEIEERYHSEEFIKEVLIELYKMRIKIS